MKKLIILLVIGTLAFHFIAPLFGWTFTPLASEWSQIDDTINITFWVTGFVFVLVPEYLPIAETRRGIDHLSQYDLHVGTLIVNKLLPESVSDPFFQGRLDQQQHYRKQIDADFPQQAKLDLPLLSHDINTLQSLQTIAHHIERALVPQDNVVSTS